MPVPPPEGDSKRLTVLTYNAQEVQRRDLDQVPSESLLPPEGKVRWMNLAGLAASDLAVLSQVLDLHPLEVEIIQDSGARPGLEFWNEHQLITLRTLTLEDASHTLVPQPISLFIQDSLVVSLQASADDRFAAIETAVAQGSGRVRRMGADYLVYLLLDHLLDQYFAILEQLGEEVGDLEEQLFDAPEPARLLQIHNHKANMITLRRAIWPLREVASRLERGDAFPLNPDTAVYMRQLYDQVVEIMDTVEILRDMVSDLMELYLSSISNRMNETMKVLTVISTLFIPLTFVTSLYGMNFRYMPELGWRWGYAGLWGILLAMLVVMFFYFRRKGWM
jgi:magnesium transporter